MGNIGLNYRPGAGLGVTGGISYSSPNRDPNNPSKSADRNYLNGTGLTFTYLTDGGYMNANLDVAGGSLLTYDGKSGQFTANYDSFIKGVAKNIGKENYKNDEDWANFMAGMADLFSGAQGTAFSGWLAGLNKATDEGTSNAAAGAEAAGKEIGSGVGAVVDAVASGASWLWNTVSAPFVAAGQWVAGQWNNFTQWAGSFISGDGDVAAKQEEWEAIGEIADYSSESGFLVCGKGPLSGGPGGASAQKSHYSAPSAGRQAELDRLVAENRYAKIILEDIDGNPAFAGLHPSDMVDKADQLLAVSGLSPGEQEAIRTEIYRRAVLRQYVPADMVKDVGLVTEGSDGYAIYDRAGNLLGTPWKAGAALQDAGLENVLMAAGLLRATAGGVFRLTAAALLRTQGVRNAPQLEALFGVLARQATDDGLRLEIAAAQLSPELREGLKQARSAVGPDARRVAGERFTADLVGGGARGRTYDVAAAEMDAAAKKLGLVWEGGGTTRIVDVTSRHGASNMLVQSESKLYTGTVRAHESIRAEIVKEVALKSRLGNGYNPVWHFYQGPPGSTTEALLKKANIPYVIYK